MISIFRQEAVIELSRQTAENESVVTEIQESLAVGCPG
jgi:hypothetical protein